MDVPLRHSRTAGRGRPVHGNLTGARTRLHVAGRAPRTRWREANRVGTEVHALPLSLSRCRLGAEQKHDEHGGEQAGRRAQPGRGAGGRCAGELPRSAGETRRGSREAADNAGNRGGERRRRGAGAGLYAGAALPRSARSIARACRTGAASGVSRAV